ncbi:2-hydroxyacyl-CoA dehydratase [Egicoccus sp. AB-alg2]|uniref:2-hydroxyacyl-CoA dehydratase n=1 Tax=Egicoccus sp. AB-alg2 TaxID=3242693 RepID=UPI00359D2DE1
MTSPSPVTVPEPDLPVVAVVGERLPRALPVAAGVTPLEVLGGPSLAGGWAAAATARSAPTLPDAEAVVDHLLGLADAGDVAGLLLGHGPAPMPRAFAILRELARREPGRLPPLHFLDLLTLPHPTTTHYNRRRLQAAGAWLGTLTGVRPTDTALARAIEQETAEAGALAARDAARSRDDVGAPDATRVFLSGAPFGPRLLDDLARLGYRVVGDEPTAATLRMFAGGGDGVSDPWEVLARRWQLADSPSGRTAGRSRALWLADIARDRDSHLLVHVTSPVDESGPWLVPWLVDALAGTATSVVVLHLDDVAGGVDAEAAGQLEAAARGNGSPPVVGWAPAPVRRAPGRRRRAVLASGEDAGTHQRQWFADLRRRVEDGDPFVVVGADAPQEILRAMDVPYVVTQWWSSIVAAKQATGRYARALAARGYPTDVEPYSAQGLAAAVVGPDDEAPWGGLPTPDVVEATLGTPATYDLYDAWAGETGAEFLAFERSTDVRGSVDEPWWDLLPHHWYDVLEPVRLDLLEGELRAAVGRLERRTGRRFDPDRLRAVMDLVNEQAEHYRATRDLIARTRPAPVSVADTMPATMVPQWHRGSTWGRDAAAALHEEVRARVEAGQVACDGERLRLLWAGRGLWGDLGFYQQLEASHGAVFVWSMYLGLAADGYLRYVGDHDPLRALAARFLTMGDELRLPGWAGPWHVKEARTHGVDGAVAIDDADPFVVADLRAAGIPTLQLPVDNMGSTNAPAVTAALTRFVEDLATGEHDPYL